MNRVFRPGILMLVAAALTLLAAAFVVWPYQDSLPTGRAMARPVPLGDQEIVWLSNATNSDSWERFVAAVQRLKNDRPALNLEVFDQNAFPDQTTAVPELAVRVGQAKGRLWFRWYKLTGDLDTREWVQAFTRPTPMPLAIIGGGSSDRARDLAGELNALTVPSPPLLLITTATADQVDVGDRKMNLMSLYPGRSFRFCFTNRQMSVAVADFIWSQDDLRPDAEPIYMAYWKDDPYSQDLFLRFRDSFYDILVRAELAKRVAREWSWGAGYSTLGGTPPGLDLRGLVDQQGPTSFFWSLGLLYSVGTFSQPNRWEAEAAAKLMNHLATRGTPQRPLLILPAIPNSARRFLRGLVRTAPVDAGRFVVATGDAIDFSTIYRDRDLAWPIQDLPFALVFFCHRNPVDATSFQTDELEDNPRPPDPSGRTSTGTQDLLLYRDIVERVVESAFEKDQLLSGADELRKRLLAGRFTDGQGYFDDEGNQRSGMGEYIVTLQPVRIDGRILPRAELRVWNREAAGGQMRKWVPVPVAGSETLTVEYKPVDQE